MAFSTQKEFFHVPFMNESIGFECSKECVKLKSYNSTIDDRCWAKDNDKQSKFVYDLVVCNTVAPLDPGNSMNNSAAGSSNGPKQRGSSAANGPQQRGPSAANGPQQRGPPASNLYGRDGNLVIGDSVINAANVTLNRMEKLLARNNILQNQLQRSNERMKTANDENEEIKRIMKQKFDPEQSKQLERKIKQLSDSGKIDKNDVSELTRIYKTIEDMKKAYDILQAENASLKRLIEKQAMRYNAFENINVDPERSSDNTYLQKRVDELRKEVIALRKMEDEMMKGKKSKEYAHENDINDIKNIINERNKLREKCKQLEGLEGQISNLQRMNNVASNRTASLTDDLNNQAKYIDDVEKEMQNMQKFYEGEVENTKFNEEVLKCRCNELKEELMQAKCQAQRADCLQMEVDVLRNELRKREVAINAYECQYQQLMHKAKSFKNAGYCFIDDVPENGLDGCFEDNEGDEEDDC